MVKLLIKLSFVVIYSNVSTEGKALENEGASYMQQHEQQEEINNCWVGKIFQLMLQNKRRRMNGSNPQILQVSHGLKTRTFL